MPIGSASVVRGPPPWDDGRSFRCVRLYRSYVRAGCGGLSGRRGARGPQWRLSGARRTKNRGYPGCFVRHHMKKPLQEKPRLKPRLAHSHPRDVAISTSSDMSAPDTKQPIFDPGMDVATVLFSHVRCVKTRVNLTLVSKLWREASKPAAAYPRTFDSDAFPESWSRQGEDILNPPRNHRIRLLDNDEALSLPYERVVGLLGKHAKNELCFNAARRGSVRLLKWTRENNRDWSTDTCITAAANGHLPALQYLHENGCPWDDTTLHYAAYNKRWDCFQYAVDNKCPLWEYYAEKHANHLR